MKETPIIFSTDMVKAILEGKKTQTRRVIKPQPTLSISDEQYKRNMALIKQEAIGGRLWVREAFCDVCWANDKVQDVCYKQDILAEGHKCANLKWKPSIFMPRWASRITLEITGIRVEKVQEISLADIQAEGIYDDRATHNALLQVEKFKNLWDSINKRSHPWSSNPWVWKLCFSEIKQ